LAKVADDIWRLRGRADELRAVADSFGDARARAALLRLADDYDRLAAHMAQFTPRFDAAADRRR
jgi:hypothetical protein